jgi:predicted aminopeptidase
MLWPLNLMQDILSDVLGKIGVCGLLSIFLLTGCAGPAWYAQAVSGHLALMSKRVEISEILADEKTDKALRQDLELAIEIRRFAIDQLGLPESDNYTQFVQTGQHATTWNIVAAPEFSLEAKKWCFIIAGCVSYRGYFKQLSAEHFANKLEKKSYDVTISPAIAYSTLGWFSDPLLDTMLQYRNEQLAALIFHELAHQQLYVKGDSAFNEAYASFVEETGVREWLLSSGRNDLLSRWQSSAAASAQFNILLQDTRLQLDGIYSSDINRDEMKIQKELVFTAMKTQYRTLVNEQWGGIDHYRSWFSIELNNARLALMKIYHGSHCAFEKLYESAGSNLQYFHQLAADRAGLSADERTDWLNQSCDR